MHQSARPQTTRNRDRALARVQSLTARTAVIATIATAGFGGLAAFTYSGVPGANTTTPADANANGITTNNTDTTTPNTAISGFQGVPAPTARTHHTAHVTSGGSGR